MSRAFRYDAEVDPGEKRHVRYDVGETYLGDPVEIPVTIVNGERDGPTAFLSAAIHGDELNGVKVLQEVADRYDPVDVRGTLVCIHVVNVPGYLSQQRDIPIYDYDLNRSFPGGPRGTTAGRMAHEVFSRFVAPCDFGIDFHTSTRNRTTMYHVRADVSNPEVDALTRAYGANVVLAGGGDNGSLRQAATAAGTPTLTVEMGKAHRFQSSLIDRAVADVENVFAARGLVDADAVARQTWRLVVDARKTAAEEADKTWIRADRGGLVDMKWGPYPVVRQDETICTISDHFRREEHVVTAPFDGLLVGVLENPLALPGHPLCHLVRIPSDTHEEIREEIERGEFDGYRANGLRWMGDGAEME